MYTRWEEKSSRKKTHTAYTVTAQHSVKWVCDHRRPFIRLSSAVSLAPPAAPVTIVAHLFRRRIFALYIITIVITIIIDTLAYLAKGFFLYFGV